MVTTDKIADKFDYKGDLAAMKKACEPKRQEVHRLQCVKVLQSIKKGECDIEVLGRNSSALKTCKRVVALRSQTPITELKKPTPTKPKKAKAKPKSQRPTVIEAKVAQKKHVVKKKKTQCTKAWAESKAEKGKVIDILRICGTKRIREYAKCFDEDHVKKNFKGSSGDCITANEERVKRKDGTNSVGFQCANEFKKSCFKELRAGNSTINFPNKADQRELPYDWSKKKLPDKRKFCSTLWQDRKGEFMDGKILREPLTSVGECVTITEKLRDKGELRK